MTTPPTATPFARLHGDDWTDTASVPTAIPSTRQRKAGLTRATKGRGSWPKHGLMLDDAAYALVAPATGQSDVWARFSTPDTSPEAPNTGSNRRSHPSGLGNQARALMPTPQAKLADAGPDYARATRAGSGGDDLTTVLAKTTLLPTPTARDHKGANRRRDSSCLTGALLPTPRARDGKGANNNPKGPDLNHSVSLLPTPRASDGTKGSPNQHGSSGDLTLPSAVHLLPTPVASDSHNSPQNHLRKKPGREVVTSLQVLLEYDLLETGGRLLPTPTAGDARSSAVQTVQNSGRPIPAGSYTLTDAARLLPTPSVADALGGHRSRSGTRRNELLLPGIAQTLAPTDPAPTGPKRAPTAPTETRR